MKIPKELLQAPMNELISGDLKETFNRIGYSGIPVWTNTGCAFFCYMDNKTCRNVKSAVHNVKMEYHEIDEYPLIRFDIIVYDDLINPLHFDSFLNIENEDHIYILDALMKQKWIIFHWYGKGYRYKGSTGVKWSEENREYVKNIVKRGEMCVERLKMDNDLNKNECMKVFNRVKDKFMKENFLE